METKEEKKQNFLRKILSYWEDKIRKITGYGRDHSINVDEENLKNFKQFLKYFNREKTIYFFLALLSAFLNSIVDENSINFVKVHKEGLKTEFSFFNIKFPFFNWLGIVPLLWFQFSMLALIVLYCFVVFCHVYYSFQIQNKANLLLRSLVSRKFFKLKGVYEKGEVLNLFNNEIKVFLENHFFIPNQIFYSLVSLAFSLFLLFRREGRKTFKAGFLITSFIFALMIFLTSYLLEKWVYYADYSYKKFLENLSRKEDILVNNRDFLKKKNIEESWQSEYLKEISKVRSNANYRDFAETASWVIPSFSLIPFSDFLILPTLLNSSGNSDLFFVSITLKKFFDSFKKVIERIKSYPKSASAFVKIKEFLQKEEIDEIQADIRIHERIESIKFKDVYFSYSPEKEILKKFEMEFLPGMNYLTAKNGFGKSTIVNIIMGLYKPSSGSVIVNNKYLLSQLNLIEWRRKIAYSENNNLIENGYSTGQKQIIDFERMIVGLKEEEIIILDEADSALDQINRNFLMEKLSKLASEGKIVIFISHQ